MNRRPQLALSNNHLKYHQDTMVLYQSKLQDRQLSTMCLFIHWKWWGPSRHPGIGVGLCGYEDGWSGQFVPGRFSGSVDREWWLLLGICLCCFSSPVCTFQLLLSCWLCRFLHPCEQMLATSLCHMQSAPKFWCWCWRPSTRLLVCLCSAFCGLLGSSSLVVVHHRTVS